MAADPKGYQAPLLIGETIVQHTRENDLDKDEKLAKAEKDLNLAIENAKAAEKPNPDISRTRSGRRRRSSRSPKRKPIWGACSCFGKNLVMPSYRCRPPWTPIRNRHTMVWLASSQQQVGKNDDAIATCDKLLAQPNLDPRFRQAATAVKLDAAKAKGGK